MSLIWIDSLDYPALGWITQVYGQSAGWSLLQAHPIEGRSVMATSSGVLRPPVGNHPAAPYSAHLSIGFLMGTAGLHSAPTRFLRIFGASTGPQLSFKGVPDMLGNLRIEVWSGDDKRRIATTSNINFTTQTHYVEIQTKISPTDGFVRIFIDGVTDGWVTGVNTQASPPSLWDWIEFQPESAGIGQLRLADLYIDNEGKVRGPMTVARLVPIYHQMYPNGPEKDIVLRWSPSPTKKRLVVMAGQSNMNGRGSNPYTGLMLNPNPLVKIWNVETQAFESLEANVNTGNPYSPGNPEFGLNWGPEVSFATFITSMFQLGGYDSTEVYIVKLAADASWVYPLTGYPVWSPSIPGNLTDTGAAEIQAAVASQGGWSQFESDIDFFWHQGESEALNPGIPPVRQEYISLTQAVFDRFEALVPQAVFHYHRTVMHDKTNSLFAASESVINMQRSNLLPGSITETSDLQLRSEDGIHLTPAGFEKLGVKYFLKWVQRVMNDDANRLISDRVVLHPSPDDRYLSTLPGLSTARLNPLSTAMQDWMHAPSVGVSPNAHYRSIAPGTLHLSIDGYLIEVPIESNATTVLAKKVVEGGIKPAKYNSEIDLRLL